MEKGTGTMNGSSSSTMHASTHMCAPSVAGLDVAWCEADPMVATAGDDPGGDMLVGAHTQVPSASKVQQLIEVPSHDSVIELLHPDEAPDHGRLTKFLQALSGYLCSESQRKYSHSVLPF